MVAAAISVAPRMMKVFCIVSFSRDDARLWDVFCVFAVAADMATRPADISARDITLGRANFLASAKYSAIAPVAPVDLLPPIRFNGPDLVCMRQ
jgi:hypothetical protein